MKNKYLYITLLSILGINPEVVLSQVKLSQAPRLVVTVTIDQLRSDYLEAFAPLYGADGFRRLLEQGLVFHNASYPFSPVDRASASASMSTGATPFYHSIVGTTWLDRATLRPVHCMGTKHTPEFLLTSTLGDELKVSTDGRARVVSISPFADVAILSGGHAADAAYWIDDASGLWSSSIYFLAEHPRWFVTFNGNASPTADISALTWVPLAEQSAATGYFQHAPGSQKPFRHKFTGSDRFAQLKSSGMVNGCVTSLATTCVEHEKLGQDDVTDLLAVSYYAGTFAHQPIASCPLEVQDTYVRLDRELATLISTIESAVGPGRVLFVITSTGYSEAESADYAKYRIPTGTFYMNRSANLLNMYMGAIWGQGRYIESCYRNEMFLNQKLLESKRISLIDACQRSQEFLTQLSGVRNVYSSFQLLTSTSEHIQKIRNGYNAARCGDILIEVAPGWQLLNEDTQQSQLARASFVQFPIIFYGAGMEACRVSDYVTVDRIAPSVAKAIRIRAPNACSAEPLF